MEITFTDRELDVMGVLWDLGSATVAEVKSRLADDLAYTTVLTILRTLEGKGRVRHEAEGRAHRYHPLVQREEAGSNALRKLVRTLFRGSPEALLRQLVWERQFTAEQLRGLRSQLEARQLEERGQ